MKGLSLMEAILALGIGAIVITQGVKGLQTYSENVRIQASASQVKRLTQAADTFANDNYKKLVAAAPQELSIDLLAPYIGDSIGTDAYHDKFVLTTRTYKITVPDPATGGTKQKDALQVMVVGQNPGPSDILDNMALRVNIANTAGAKAGFLADGNDIKKCNDVTVTATDACGAFGAYVIDTTKFSATNFSDATVVSLVTKGDSSVYGDQLYRYDYGDPELNTMHTSIEMGNNDLNNPRQINGVNHVQFDGGAQNIVTKSGNLTIAPAGGLHLHSGGNINVQAQDDTATFQDMHNTVAAGDNPASSDYFKIRALNGNMRFDNIRNVFGDFVDQTQDGNTLRYGSGNVWAGLIRARSGNFTQINSLFPDPTDALRIQKNRQDSITIFGKRVRYTPDGDPSAGTYEISDGDIMARNATVQDITCADCGGSLSHILPKWRMMGNYYIPESATNNGSQIVRVPKPVCTASRANLRSDGAHGSNLPYQETQSDQRYVPRILVIPRKMAFPSGNIDVRFNASDAGTDWLVQADASNGTSGAGVSAFANTYCVFYGGGNGADPTVSMPDLPGTGSPGYNRIE